MPNGRLPVFTILLLSLIVTSTLLDPHDSSTVNSNGYMASGSRLASTAASSRPFDYILIIVMENKNFSQINGNPQAPFLNQLAQNYSLATRYTACDHPSLPNYMCLTGGYNYFSGRDCFPSGTCTTGNSSIVDRIENAGMTWKAYMEDMPSPCFKSGVGNYTYLTNPFIFYKDIETNSTRCAAHDVPANSGGKGLPDDNLVNALSSTSTASNFMWLTPNLCDNMHNCSITRGDNYLGRIIPAILGSYIFRTQKAALFITFDEGYGHYPSDYVYTTWAGSVVKTHYLSSTQYSHYSLAATLEAAWGLEPLTAKDLGTSSMTEFFLPPPEPPPMLTVGFAFSPPNPDNGTAVSFTGSARGGTLPYQYIWSLGDGSMRIGPITEYSYQSVGNYTVILTVTDQRGQRAMTSHGISIDTDPKPTPTAPAQMDTTFPRVWGLMISFVIGVALPLLLSFVVSRMKLKAGYETQSEVSSVKRTEGGLEMAARRR